MASCQPSVVAPSPAPRKPSPRARDLMPLSSLEGLPTTGSGVGPWRCARLIQRALIGCRSARAFTLVTPLVGLGFTVAAAAAGPSAAAHLSLQRLALEALSWVSGLLALSAAGPALARELIAARGLLEARGLPTQLELDWALPLATLQLTVTRIAPGLLVMLGIEAALGGEATALLKALGTSIAVGVYLMTLGASLGVLALASRALGGSLGRWVLLGLVLCPMALEAAWPALLGPIEALHGMLLRCLELAR